MLGWNAIRLLGRATTKGVIELMASRRVIMLRHLSTTVSVPPSESDSASSMSEAPSTESGVDNSRTTGTDMSREGSEELRHESEVADSGSNTPGTDTSREGSEELRHESGVDDERHQERQLRLRILEASLPLVDQHGWSTETLAAGAESLGLPDVAHGLFPRGGVELVNYFYVDCNGRLVTQMSERRAAELESGPPRSQAFIRWAVEQRLRMVAPYLAHWSEALALLALPYNLPTSLAYFGALLDDVWHYAGDRSSDFNWYTKRAVLAAVYKTTELRLLTDSSEDFAETWAFLTRRLEDAGAFGRRVRQCREVAPQAAHTVSVLVNTAANMAGLNSRR